MSPVVKDGPTTDIKISLNYLAPLSKYATERPYEMWIDPIPSGLKRTNVEFDLTSNITLTDIRELPLNAQPQLDREGFEVLERPYPQMHDLSTVDDLDQNDERRAAMRSYLNAMTELVRKEYGGIKVVCYDWRVRKATNKDYDQTPRVEIPNIPDGGEVREQTITAAFNVHGGKLLMKSCTSVAHNHDSDGSPNNLKRQLLYLLSEEEQLQLANRKVRLRALNLWRPIVRVETGPLALCDVNSVQEEDWEPVDKVFDDWVEESMYIKHRPEHKWYWLSNQTPDEAIMFVIWDSARASEKKAAVAHCSFKLPPHLVGNIIRQSIEMRMLLWTQD